MIFCKNHNIKSLPRRTTFPFILLLFVSIVFSDVVVGQLPDTLVVLLNKEFFGQHSSDFYLQPYNYVNGKRVSVDSVFFDAARNQLEIHFNKALAEMPVREGDEELLVDKIRRVLPSDFSETKIDVFSNGVLFRELIPNYNRKNLQYDTKRLPQKGMRPERKNVVERVKPYSITNGLENANIALWNSHGWYYETKLDRWEWQRARLFTTIEDILPTSLVLPFITPMLENAGANVFIPRERDWQINEVIVDNDASTGKSKFRKPKNRTHKTKGFSIGNPPYDHENPFQLGTAVNFEGGRKENVVEYIPDFDVAGDYAVYVSYGEGDGKVTYRVHHSGGINDFVVDQSMGFGTWIYLDKFNFENGRNKNNGKVELITPKNSQLIYSADAVRFGGGLGQMERKGKTSQRARFFEGARYHLQFSGAPDTLVWDLSEGADDYADDYKCRGEWVNWLMGAPFGPTKNNQYPGLNVPVDMAFAFHTDAGILPNKEIVGTLGIYSTDRDSVYFADGQSKYASRDLTDLVQTQIVDDINAVYGCNWARRGMWDSQYSEAYRPNVPTMLLELLSHQNLNDMRFMLHPKFKFDVSRAIYKGMLRFISTQNDYEYIIQPLPVDNITSKWTNENTVELSWLPVADPLEPTAKAKKYMVYQSEGSKGFDSGTLTENTNISIGNLESEKVYNFKITAVNQGGESFPSEVISVGRAEKSKGDILIVNGFDRIDGPAIFEGDSLSGVLRQLDNGVAYGFDIGTVGDQYDFDRSSPWLDDDSPGHGASYANLETNIFRGNTFDFSTIHGKSILAAGYLLFGEEKTTYLPGNDTAKYFSIYTEKMLTALEKYSENGGDIFISGAYIGTDIPKDSASVARVGNLLKFKWRTNHAVLNGQFYSVDKSVHFSGQFNTGYNLVQYPVEAPDGIEPYDESGKTIFRYTENNVSAATIAKGKYNVAALGFPFESVEGEAQRNQLFKEIVNSIIQK